MSSARQGGSSSGGSGRGGARVRASAAGRSKSPDMLPGQQPGLRRLVQKRLLDDVFEAASGKSQQEQREERVQVPS
jgi:hypothetical protein